MSREQIQYWLDSVQVHSGVIYVSGWSCTNDGHRIMNIYIVDGKNNKVESNLMRSYRPDAVQSVCGKNDSERVGFSVAGRMNNSSKYYLCLKTNDGKKKILLTGFRMLKQKLKTKLQLIKGIGNNDAIRRDFAENSTITYREFALLSMVKDDELNKQRKEVFPENAPKFSVLVPLYNTPVKFLNEMIESVVKQTYKNWELCLADGSDEEHIGPIQKAIKSFGDERILYKKLDHNGGISENTNAALAMAKGDFIVLFDHDDLLTPNALYEFAKVIMKDPECDSVYSDEDKINSDTGEYFEPHFKPDFNIDKLCSDNYICHLFAVKKKLTDKFGGFRSEFDGAQDHDFILRMTEQSRHVLHIPKVLYHWRSHQNSTAMNPESKMYAFTAGQNAVKAHYARVWPKIKIDAVENGISLGIYHTIWHFDEYPLISVIIPNMDHTLDLDKVIRSMNEKGTWPNLEFIIVENNSKNNDTFEYYEKIQKEYDNVHVVYYKDSFNYSKINNFGVKFAKGEYYLLMNNDIELIEPNSIKEMMGYCQRPDVGIVGARLLYEDNTIQHAGVVIGLRGVASHAFKNQMSENGTYFNRAMIAQDYSAVTAAVMLVKKSVFEDVNGLDEKFEVALNDIDFCLRVRNTGKLVVYNPYACFHHYESKSRGLEDTEEKYKRFQREIARFISIHHDILENGDPYYNPNLTLHCENFGLRNIKFEKVGQQFYTTNEVNGLEQIENTCKNSDSEQ